MLKRGRKRALAMMLSLSMIVGGINITAFADTNSTQAKDAQTVSDSLNEVEQSGNG